MSKSIIYLDGQYVAVQPELLEVFTPGRIQWQGVFETIRCCDGQIEFLTEHVNRMLTGLKVLKIKHNYTAAKLKQIARQVLRRNPSIQLGRLRLMVFQISTTLHCTAMVMPYTPPSALKVKLIQTDRQTTSKWADVKSLRYGMFADAYRKARAAGCDEALLINRQGHIFEASRANVFIISNGRLITPPLSSGCLNGIIRQQVLLAAKELNVPVQEQGITPAMLKNADRIFLTNSLNGLVPASLPNRKMGGILSL